MGARVIPSDVEGSGAGAAVACPMGGSLDFARDDTRAEEDPALKRGMTREAAR